MSDTDQNELLTKLWDIEQIKQLKARYFRYVDTRDWDNLVQLFTADCTFWSARTDVHGAQAFVERIGKFITPGVSVHHGHMPEITITGTDTATGIWAMFDYVEVERAGSSRSFKGYGHYHETYQKQVNGQWLISSWRLERLRYEPGSEPNL